MLFDGSITVISLVSEIAYQSQDQDFARQPDAHFLLAKFVERRHCLNYLHFGQCAVFLFDFLGDKYDPTFV